MSTSACDSRVNCIVWCDIIPPWLGRRAVRAVRAVRRAVRAVRRAVRAVRRAVRTVRRAVRRAVRVVRAVRRALRAVRWAVRKYSKINVKKVILWKKNYLQIFAERKKNCKINQYF